MMLDSVGKLLDDVGWSRVRKSGKSNSHPTKQQQIQQNEKPVQHKNSPY